MAICSTCGNETARIITHFEGRDGKPLPLPKDSCPKCDPEAFPQEPVLMPSDKRFYGMWEVEPEQYDTLCYEDGERVPIVKDWARGEFEQQLIDAPVAAEEEKQAIEKKRAFARERNKYPMTPEQVAKVQEYYTDEMKKVERMIAAEEAGLILP